MIRTLGAARAICLLAWLASSLAVVDFARADPAPVPIGYLAWDVTQPGTAGEFDIVNLTGANSSYDASWPVLTAVTLSNLHLVVDFTNGSTSTFDASYFDLSADGISFDGTPLSISAGSALPIHALLTGDVGPTSITLFDGQPLTLTTSFSTAIDWRNGGLADGDLQLIEVPPLVIAAVPEPGTGALLTAGITSLLLVRRRRQRRSAAIAAVIAVGAMAAMPASAAIKLATWTAPSSGTAGSDYVNVTATGVVLPVGQTFQSANVSLAVSCGGAPVATMQAASVKPIPGNSWRIQFLLPATLGSGTYAISMAGLASDTSPLISGNCAQVAVTAAPGGGWTTLIGRDWTMPPDSEIYKCIILPLTQDADLSAFHVVAPPGNPQLLLTLQGTAGPIGPFDCGSNAIGNRGVFMAGSGANDLVLPAGAAVHLRAGEYLNLNLHLINQTTQTQNGRTEVQVRTVPAATVTTPTAMQFLGTTGLSIPADSILHAYSGHCTADRDLDVLALAPRMNVLGRQIQVTRTPANATSPTGVLLDVPYDISSELNYLAAPPVRFSMGDVITATCKFRNTTGHSVIFGDGIEDEQCFVGAYVTPPSNNTSVYPSPPIKSCLEGNL